MARADAAALEGNQNRWVAGPSHIREEHHPTDLLSKSLHHCKPSIHNPRKLQIPKYPNPKSKAKTPSKWEAPAPSLGSTSSRSSVRWFQKYKHKFVPRTYSDTVAVNVDVDWMDPEYIKSMLPFRFNDQTSNQLWVDIQLGDESNAELLKQTTKELKDQGWLAIYTRMVRCHQSLAVASSVAPD